MKLFFDEDTDIQIQYEIKFGKEWHDETPEVSVRDFLCRIQRAIQPIALQRMEKLHLVWVLIPWYHACMSKVGLNF